jgi:hypothetical protein
MTTVPPSGGGGHGRALVQAGRRSAPAIVAGPLDAVLINYMKIREQANVLTQELMLPTEFWCDEY